MSAESHRTSFFALTSHEADGAAPIERVEIPLFQRDYAQGRESHPVPRIRNDFLDVLRKAVGDGATPVGLDFVYGGVDGGTLRPLDGQQRLTTLFLLHWYIASRSGHTESAAGWTQFSYATRQSAKMFCESLKRHPLPSSTEPAAWIRDQPWYQFLWRHDPTIQSMLVMLDAIHEKFHDIDPATAWARLTDDDDPAIWFLLLPLSGLGSDDGAGMAAEELYIKMNSRGKPLTEFENFKAHFEKTIEWSPRAGEFALKVDTTWSDVLWHLRGEDDLIDDEFLRYLGFITEVCEWRDGTTDGARQPLGPRTAAVFGLDNPNHEAHLGFLFEALDVWAVHTAAETFDSLFQSEDEDSDVSKVRLFFRTASSAEEPLNLFAACCRSHGITRGKTRSFSLGQSLLLYAILLHLIENSPDFRPRLRTLRNLVEASTDELRPDRMPKIIDDVHHLIRNGAIENVTTLNQAQADDERAKADFLASNPDLQATLFGLEDHELLHGSLGAFELSAENLANRASTFRALMADAGLWPDLVAGLLAVGPYQRQKTNSRPFLFGTSSKAHAGAWRDLLTGPRRDALQPTRQVLTTFLDRVAAEPPSLDDRLRAIAAEYVNQCEAASRFDWRYYMVKYPSMREGGSSTYYAERYEDSETLSMGYSLCMLRAGGSALNGYYRDPYLLTIWRELDSTEAVQDQWFTGYENEARRLPLTRSGATIRCVPAGFELGAPPLAEFADAFTTVCTELGVGDDRVVLVPQLEVDGKHVDTIDRIQRGADVVRLLIAAGL